MYEWEKVDPVIDSTLRLIHGAAKRGHNVSIINPGNPSPSAWISR